MKRASLLTLTLIGAFSAIQAAWLSIIRYHQPEADWSGKIKRYAQEGDKNLQAIATF